MGLGVQGVQLVIIIKMMCKIALNTCLVAASLKGTNIWCQAHHCCSYGHGQASRSAAAAAPRPPPLPRRLRQWTRDPACCRAPQGLSAGTAWRAPLHRGRRAAQRDGQLPQLPAAAAAPPAAACSNLLRRLQCQDTRVLPIDTKQHLCYFDLCILTSMQGGTTITEVRFQHLCLLLELLGGSLGGRQQQPWQYPLLMQPA